MNVARPLFASRRVRTRILAVALLAFVVLLAACGVAGSPASEQATLAAAETPLPTATPVRGTPTPDTDPFQVVLSDHYTAISCPVGEAAGSYCANITGSGTASGTYGEISLARTANLATPYVLNGCVPTSTYGTLTLGTRGGVTFKGEGTHCGSNGSASYTYDITGGSGTLAGSTGHGVIVVTAITGNSGTERWSGTLVLPH
jgi:hypothetical protein